MSTLEQMELLQILLYGKLYVSLKALDSKLFPLKLMVLVQTGHFWDRVQHCCLLTSFQEGQEGDRGRDTFSKLS